MIDARLDREMELGDRAAAVTDAQRAFAVQARMPAATTTGGRLTREEALARKTRAREADREARESSVAVAPTAPTVPVDSAATLRHARIGLFAALTLVLVLIWIMQRRKGTRR